MDEQLLVGAASILVLGIAAQWFADRLRLPAILLLLLAGFLAGPVAGFLRPSEVLGDELLATTVGLAVAIVLFDGGLGLRFSEIRDVRAVVRRLITAGLAITFVVGTIAARLLLPLSWRMSMLLAAILVVSGPTVILPMLRQLRLRGHAASVIKWEGIFNDPIGAVLAVLIFEVIVVGGERQEFGVSVLLGLGRTALAGVLIGLAAAGVTVVLIERFLVPAHLEIPVTVMIVITAYTTSNLVQAESGLLAATVMGVALANQRRVPVRHIVEFGETVGIFLTSILFVVLAADLKLDDLAALGWPVVGFIAALVLVARPLATWVSTLGSELDRRERVVVGWMAPRGIVAASVASVFGLRLADAGVDGAELLTPYVFTTIVATAAIYGLTAPPLARRLGIADPQPQGVAFVGAPLWARRVAEALSGCDIDVLLIPTNRADLAAARLDGLRVHWGDILDEDAFERLDLAGIGSVIAVTHNEEFNALAGLRFMEVLGRQHVFQLAADRAPGVEGEVSHDLRGRLAFGDTVTYQVLEERFASGASVRRTRITETFDYDDLLREHDGHVTPLFLLRDGTLEVVSRDDPRPAAGTTVVALVGGVDPSRDEPDGDAIAISGGRGR